MTHDSIDVQELVRTEQRVAKRSERQGFWRSVFFLGRARFFLEPCWVYFVVRFLRFNKCFRVLDFGFGGRSAVAKFERGTNPRLSIRWAGSL